MVLQLYKNERTTNPEAGKSRYTHKRLRSAYLSLKRNLPYLFTFETHPTLDIPNTTNLLESHFSELKAALRCHRGLSQKHKMQFIMDYFSVICKLAAILSISPNFLIKFIIY